MKNTDRVKGKKYNTDRLVILIDNYCESRRYKRPDFIGEICDLTGSNKSTFTTHLYGFNRLRPDEAVAISAALNISEDDVWNMITPVNQKDSVKPIENKATAAKNTGNEKYSIDVDALEKLEKEHGISAYKMEERIKAAGGIHKQWRKGRKIQLKTAEKIAKELGGISCQKFLIGYHDDGSVVQEKKEILPVKKTTPVDGVSDVFHVFRIINNNIQTVLEEVQQQDERAMQQSECLGTVMAAVSNIADNMSKLEEKMDGLLSQFSCIQKDIQLIGKHAPVKVSMNSGKIPREEREQADVLPSNPMSLQYDYQDGINEYSKKIDSFVRVICNKKGLTMNQVRSDLYTELNKVYGVVYEQLQKEYYEKYGKKQTWTLALIHNNPLFAQIFFNMVKDHCQLPTV